MRFLVWPRSCALVYDSLLMRALAMVTVEVGQMSIGHCFAINEADMDEKKVLLVCTESCTEVEECLQHTDYQVIKVHDGATAVERAKHTTIAAAILVSSGRAMDRTETALNLRDIIPAVKIIMIATHKDRDGNVPPSERLGGRIPNTKVLTPNELDDYFASPEWRGTETER